MNYKYFLTNAVSLLNATFNPFIWSDFKSKLNELFRLEGYDNSVAIRYYKKETTNTDIEEILNNVTKISKFAFDGYTGLTSVTIPDNVINIDYKAFNNCTNLTNLVIGNGITSISNIVFSSFPNLTNIVIGNGVTSILSQTFKDCTSLTSITIPNSVTSIGDGAFYNCTSLTSIIIPDSVTNIGSSAFDGCTSLTSITIPDSVTSIGNSAFSDTAWYNSQPNGDIYAGKVYYEYKGKMPENTSVEIKVGTKAIAEFAFDNCTSLTSVILPDSVISIGNKAFQYCTNLALIDFSTHTVIPTFGTEVFYNISSNFVIKVPAALLDEWKAAENQSAYADHIIAA